VLLRLDSNHERGNIDDLSADSDVSLLDQDSGVMVRLGHTQLEDLGLESSIQKVVDLESKDKIQLVLMLVQDSVSVESSQKSSALKHSLGILGILREQVSCSLSDVRENSLDSPHFSLVLQSVLSNDSEFGIETLLLKGTSGCLGGLRIVSKGFGRRHD